MVEERGFKRIGIACDNYKSQKYEKELKLKNYDFEISSFTSFTKIITVEVPINEIENFTRFVKETELSFKHSN